MIFYAIQIVTENIWLKYLLKISQNSLTIFLQIKYWFSLR